MSIEEKEEFSRSEIQRYKDLIISEMLKLGVIKDEISTIKDATIRNVICRNKDPKDVAMAILL